MAKNIFRAQLLLVAAHKCVAFGGVEPDAMAQADEATEFRTSYVAMYESYGGGGNAVPYTMKFGTAACEENYNGISRINGARDMSYNQCTQWCDNTPRCQAIDYYQYTDWCNLYSESCNNPITTKDGATHHVRNAPVPPAVPVRGVTMEYSLVNYAACEDNYDGIPRLDGIPNIYFNECTARCDNDPRCEAIDYFYDTNWCNLFADSCGQGWMTKDGASHWIRVSYVG